MRVSIIVPVYNASKFIERCARSLFEQTYKDVEYIFVDDASVDDSIEKLNVVMNDYPQLRDRVVILQSKENRGAAITRKRGMQAATGDYMIHVDCDDYVDKRYVELMACKASSENADIVICDLCYDYGKKKKIRPANPCSDISKLTGQVLSGKVHSSLCNKLLRSSIIKDYSIYPIPGLKVGEDKCVILGFLYHAKSLCYVNEPLYFYDKTNALSIITQRKENLVHDYMKLTGLIQEFYSDKDVNEDVADGIKFYVVLVMGHILLYSKSLTLEQKRLLDDIGYKHIFKQPVAPFYYKMACALFKCKLGALIACMRGIMGMLKK